MMKSPWKQVRPFEAGARYVALASHIPPKRRASTWRLFKGSRAVTKQLTQTEGVVGFSLLARPLKKEYATISLWIDDEALAAFARSAPHAELRSELASEMAPTTFLRWEVAATDGVPTWREVLERLSSARTTTPSAPR